MALALPSPAGASYGWPVRPFGQEHPVRGQLNDPRMDGLDFYSSKSHTFHFGLDVAAPDGKAVYAVVGGRVHYVSSSALTVRSSKGASNFAYWHIRPAVRDGKSVRLHALLGYIAPGYGHVHFAEKRDGRYINPLRRGALTPYNDTTPPTIASLEYHDGVYHGLAGATLSGTVGLAVNAFDTPQLVSNWPWAITTPARIEWKLYDAAGRKITAGRWDLGSELSPLDPLMVFAPDTLKNNRRGAGLYNYWLGPRWDTTRVPNGAYGLVVTASDIRGNETAQSVSFVVTNSPAAPVA
ncbi:MAG: M23 family metallopeptidase [Gaiellaceae bacterium]